MMPDMDGIEATTAIREWEAKQGKREGVPIIALTANAVSGMREMFLEKDFNDFIAKPIDVSKLDDMLDRWIPKEKKMLGSGEQGAGSRERSSNNDPHSLLHDIRGLDVQRGIALMGSEAKYIKVLITFCNDAQERIEFFQKPPEEKDLHAFTIQVHALKSASASVGAVEISAYAARLEEAGRAGDIAFIEESLSEFVFLLTEMIKKITAVAGNKL